jgi:hypothetical protein
MMSQGFCRPGSLTINSKVDAEQSMTAEVHRKTVWQESMLHGVLADATHCQVLQ